MVWEVFLYRKSRVKVCIRHRSGIKNDSSRKIHCAVWKKLITSVYQQKRRREVCLEKQTCGVVFL